MSTVSQKELPPGGIFQSHAIIDSLGRHFVSFVFYHSPLGDTSRCPIMRVSVPRSSPCGISTIDTLVETPPELYYAGERSTDGLTLQQTLY
jgi:hypothetical protein